MNLLDHLEALPAGVISTIAGAGYRDGVPAKEADAGWPLGVVRRPDGDLIVVDYQAHRLWRIDQEGVLHAFAGDGVPGNSGDDGPAKQARFFGPHDLTQDKHGNLFLSDLGNYTYRRIDHKTGIITRVAGSGRKGRGGDGGSALDAELDTTCGIAIDDEGNLYLSSEWGNNIRRVDAKTGIIELFAGQDGRDYPSEIGQGQSRPIFGSNLSLMGFHGDGGPARDAAFHNPEHLAFDSKGDLYVCDNANHRIRKIDMATGIITTVLGNGQQSSNGDGGLATNASILMPDAICLDNHDNLYVGEKYGFRVRKVDANTGIVTTLVGNGVPGFGEEGLHGSQTHCNSVEAGIWADPDGTVLWGDCSGRIRRYDGKTGIVTTVLGGTSVHDGEPAIEGFLNGPGGLSIGKDGMIFIADVWNQRIRAIDPKTAIIKTVAGNGARAYGGDNEQATQAYLGNPHDVSADSLGRIVIADSRNGRLRRVELDGTIQTIAGTTLPWDGSNGRWDKGDHGPAVSASFVAVLSIIHAPNDDILVGDGVGRIRRINAQTGIITTIAGIGQSGYSGDWSLATQAKIGSPTALCLDSQGALYFADSTHHVIRKVDKKGVISTVVGTGAAGFSADGTIATDANIDTPWGVILSASDQLYFSDSRNGRVRRVSSDGRLETVAGCEQFGDQGECVIATKAHLNEPHGLAFLNDDVLLISDHFNNRIKVVRIGD
ncbi:MAG: sugar lactone lactonase YvrE [Cellvibrionaceae bacterium]|jgi:sugar lactone lactonase YvrE